MGAALAPFRCSFRSIGFALKRLISGVLPVLKPPMLTVPNEPASNLLNLTVPIATVRLRRPSDLDPGGPPSGPALGGLVYKLTDTPSTSSER